MCVDNRGNVVAQRYSARLVIKGLLVRDSLEAFMSTVAQR